MNYDLIKKVESLKTMLVSKATAGECDDLVYTSLRRELIALASIKPHLPEVVNVCRNLAEFWAYIQPRFKTYSERREFLRKEFETLLQRLESDPCSPCDLVITATIQATDLDYVKEAWQKALERRATDAEGAITASRTLLESICKHILESAAVNYDDAAELPKLYALTARQLNLSPSQHSEQLFKQILGGCQTVVEGLGAMRNKHSDAHGKGQLATKPAARHAELAVNLSGAMATFLLQTWQVRQK